MTDRPRIAITTGDPAGIGPEIALRAAADSHDACLVAIGDRAMMRERARALAQASGVEVAVHEYDADDSSAHRRGVLPVLHHPCRTPARVGELDADNGAYTIDCINAAVDSCRDGAFDALATAPVNKEIINRAGIAFRGHTEWIAQRCGAPTPVMMLTNHATKNPLRVCLLTNHIALAEVPRAVTAKRLREVIITVVHDLRTRFDIAHPALGVCGLNPHAGEGGYIGSEDREVIAPTLDALRADESLCADLIGPLPADTAFTRARLASLDAVLAMYHDQGLPVIKHANFGATVNITLGLPIVRTSVDHGTAIDIADAFEADESSMKAAIEMAVEIAGRARGA